jgi:hypothetical protein
MNPQLRFAENFNNKLSCRIFTTFRAFTCEKLDFHSANLGAVYDIFLHAELFTEARLVGIRYTRLSDVPELLLMLDTGQSEYDDALAVFAKLDIKPSDDVLWLVLENLKPL